MEILGDHISIAVVNFKVVYGDKEANLKKIIEITTSAAGAGADLVLFPEMCLTGYDIYLDEAVEARQIDALAETIPGKAADAVAEAAKSHQVYVVFGMPQKILEEDKIYNAAVVAGPEGLVGSYQKIHPYCGETRWFSKGDTPFMFNTRWGLIGVGICYDTYSFPELMRYYASKGARLYLNLTASIRENVIERPFEEGYLTYLKYGVLSNHIYIASSNLVGLDKTNSYGGGSLVIGPRIVEGSMIYSHCYGGGVDNIQEGFATAEIDLSKAKRTIYQPDCHTGEPAYRADLYKAFY